jgi:NodT family efflux transporter outer membrane factor (OMF) lipoprotein
MLDDTQTPLMSRLKGAGTLLPPTLLISALVLNGCSVGPSYSRPELQLPSEFQTQLDEAAKEESTDLAEWWSAFDDDQLNTLIDRAVKRNLDIKEALFRVQESRALRGIASTTLLPTIDSSGSYSRSESSTKLTSSTTTPRVTTNNYSLGIDASWEVDLWGRNRRGVEAADADLDASIENTRDVLVTVMAEIALNYIELRTFQERLRIARANVVLQEQTLDITENKFKANLVSKLDVSQARSNLESTRSAVPTLISGLRGIENRIAVLLGLFPGELQEELAAVVSIPTPPSEIMIGIPADIVRQRADIRAAERELAGQTARVGVATADLYPRLTLTGNIGFQAASTSDLFTSGARASQFGPSLVWNLFDRKRLKNQIKAEDARVDQSLARYERTVLVAFEEVENAMIEFQQEQKRTSHLVIAVADARTAVDLSRDRYQQGLTDFQSVIDTQTRLFQLEDSLAISQGSISTALIRLYKSLGGGWESRDIVMTEQPTAQEDDS